jgi:hypothetical protein
LQASGIAKGLAKLRLHFEKQRVLVHHYLFS